MLGKHRLPQASNVPYIGQYLHANKFSPAGTFCMSSTFCDRPKTSPKLHSTIDMTYTFSWVKISIEYLMCVEMHTKLCNIFKWLRVRLKG